MDNQEAFNRIVTHLRKQRYQAVNCNCACVYRAPSGRRCAVGVLLTDEMYSPAFEGHALITNATPLELTLRQFYPDVDIDMLIDLQSMHDSYTSALDWEMIFPFIAKKYNVQVPPHYSTVTTKEFKELSEYKPVAVEVH